VKPLRIAAFGFRSFPPKDGSAGEDKFAYELYPRLVKRGHRVTGYTRVYERGRPVTEEREGVLLYNLRTTRRSGFDTLVHSCRATFHIITHRTGNIVHIHNGGNSIWALLLRLTGRKVFISQDGIDWKREKWPWYAKLYLFLSMVVTAYLPNNVIFDNVYAKDFFERRFKKRYLFIPYGSEVSEPKPSSILERLGLRPGGYFLFVGRFIPDKGLQYLIPAFAAVRTDKKLVLVGGTPNPSEFERTLKETKDERVIFPGFVYGNDVNYLIKNAYAYIQPSDIEGLSPVILTVMGLGVPLICSDIKENVYIVGETAVTFERGDVDSLRASIEYALGAPEEIARRAGAARTRVMERFKWEHVVDRHVEVFSG
jgi:glycosyltransferase involved in cell wall biosynthesis